MLPLRRFLLDRPALCALIVACALLLKIVVPSGFMLGDTGHGITIEVCSGMSPMQMTAMPGMDHRNDKPDRPAKEMPCAFAALSAATVAAADAVLLALALVFIVATVFRAAIPAIVQAPAFLRPPLRGPPVRR